MIKNIMCICGNGSGSSFLLEMNVKKVLKKLGIHGVEVNHTSLTDAQKGLADLVICANDIYENVKPFGDALGIMNIMSIPEIEDKIKPYFL